MRPFRKIWDVEKNEWILNHKDLEISLFYKMFCKKFPDADVSYVAFKNQRCRLGAVLYHNKHPSTRSRPLYSEHNKKGYVFIKVAQPSVWKSKGRWVYEETHPGYEYSQKDAFIFLDGNNLNFHPNNVEVIHKSELLLFQKFGGIVKGQPELSKVHLLQARLRMAQFDAGEKINGVVTYINKKNGKGIYRVFREEINTRARQRNSKLSEAQRLERNRKAVEKYHQKKEKE